MIAGALSYLCIALETATGSAISCLPLSMPVAACVDSQPAIESNDAAVWCSAKPARVIFVDQVRRGGFQK